MKHRTIRASLIAISASLLMMSTALAGVITPDPVKTTRRDEANGSGNAGYFAWTRDVAGQPNRFQVWVDPTGAGSAFNVNERGASRSGQMDPTGVVLPYWRFVRRQADIRLFDMSAQQHVQLPAGINTARSEVSPAIDSGRMTFVRLGNVNTTLFLVGDLTTGSKIAIKTIRTDRAFFAIHPRLNGNWVTYAICTRRKCEAYRYDIAAPLTQRIPNPRGLLYYAASPDLAGNVYFARSGFACGRAVRLMKWTGAGDPAIVYAFARGTDVTGTMAFDDGAMITVFVDFFDCRTGKGDIYSFTNP